MKKSHSLRLTQNQSSIHADKLLSEVDFMIQNICGARIYMFPKYSCKYDQELILLYCFDMHDCNTSRTFNKRSSEKKYLLKNKSNSFFVFPKVLASATWDGWAPLAPNAVRLEPSAPDAAKTALAQTTRTATRRPDNATVRQDAPETPARTSVRREASASTAWGSARAQTAPSAIPRTANAPARMATSDTGASRSVPPDTSDVTAPRRVGASTAPPATPSAASAHAQMAGKAPTAESRAAPAHMAPIVPLSVSARTAPRAAPSTAPATAPPAGRDASAPRRVPMALSASTAPWSVN